MNARDDMNRASSRAADAREELSRATDELERAAEHTGEAARHAKEAMKAGASGTLERGREAARETTRRAGQTAGRVADSAREVGRQAGHVAERMGNAQPNRELEHRADTTTEKVLDRTGGALKGAAPTVGKGVETATRMTGSALHMVAGPLGTVVGKIVGQVGGWWKSRSEKTAAEFPKEEEQLCLQHFEAYELRPAELTFDTARTAYQIGYLAAENPDYHERGFDAVEADVGYGFTAEPAGEYNALRDFARFGYERAMVIRLPEDGDRVTVR